MVHTFPVLYPSQRMFISLCVIFAVLPVVAVVLRVIARRMSNRKLDLSDKIMIGACVLLVIYQGVNISAVLVGGLGIPGEQIENEFGIRPSQEMFIKHLLAMQVMWTTDITIVKISILTLYLRIFTMRAFIIAAKVTMALCVTWMIIMGAGSIFICRPFALYWDPTLPGECGNLLAFWIFTGTLNIVTDLTILVLPMPYLYGLEIALYRKLVLIATFGIGFIVCIVSSIRLKALVGYEQSDSTGTTIPTALLSVMEPALGIILGCVPLLRPLFGGRYSATGTAKLGPRSTSEHNSSENSKGSKVSKRSFNQLKDDTGSETQLRPEQGDYEVGAGRATPHAGSERTGSFELGRISMKKTWAVDEELALGDESHGSDASGAVDVEETGVNGDHRASAGTKHGRCPHCQPRLALANVEIHPRRQFRNRVRDDSDGDSGAESESGDDLKEVDTPSPASPASPSSPASLPSPTSPPSPQTPPPAATSIAPPPPPAPAVTTSTLPATTTVQPPPPPPPPAVTTANPVTTASPVTTTSPATSIISPPVINLPVTTIAPPVTTIEPPVTTVAPPAPPPPPVVTSQSQPNLVKDPARETNDNSTTDVPATTAAPSIATTVPLASPFTTLTPIAPPRTTATTSLDTTSSDEQSTTTTESPTTTQPTLTLTQVTTSLTLSSSGLGNGVPATTLSTRASPSATTRRESITTGLGFMPIESAAPIILPSSTPAGPSADHNDASFDTVPWSIGAGGVAALSIVIALASIATTAFVFYKCCWPRVSKGRPPSSVFGAFVPGRKFWEKPSSAVRGNGPAAPDMAHVRPGDKIMDQVMAAAYEAEQGNAGVYGRYAERRASWHTDNSSILEEKQRQYEAAVAASAINGTAPPDPRKSKGLHLGQMMNAFLKDRHDKPGASQMEEMPRSPAGTTSGPTAFMPKGHQIEWSWRVSVRRASQNLRGGDGGDGWLAKAARLGGFKS
ncbi:uncharacterized protein B0I36DRAFT_379081 [Microdochium trichocladiopsis]|uniref:Rhodopsin domain-containing protein n=1 Tax=Microdochium trichocladiopsis TaxID=1682393 RepID=A0A9P8YGT1_9PEZI|nr:uncharacterized protein B0I36DRAFT_379081 [Microdochium trichocladiopsis]KAH7040010.1 hypothetical protein B0I36DRAFT_379081 [Microdochium trichocladiopsis]